MKPITIIGGGLAGLTLGIQLRRREVPVTIVEAGHYPRHRVCGEFICGRGVDTLRKLDVAHLAEPNLRPARDASFFVGPKEIARHRLPAAALCVSREFLDSSLASHFQRLGGLLREGERSRASASAGTVLATGRRAHATQDGWRWFGLKVHARRASLCADLEMHLGADSYVGMCRLPGDRVNVCGLFRRRVDEPSGSDTLDMLRGAPDSELFHRLRQAEFDPTSLCAIAGLSLKPRQIASHECLVGDAMTMIPPITGNGMSIAFESAELATEPLAAYAREEVSWEEALRRISESFHQRFTRRLHWAWQFHRLIFSRLGQPTLSSFFRVPAVWRKCFALTR